MESAQVRLALHVDHFAVAQARGRADADHRAEAFAADLVDRQAVDLAGALAAGVDEQHAAPHRVGQPLVDAPGALAPRRDGGAHVVALDGGGAAPARQVVGLVQHVEQEAHARAQARAVFGQARAVVDAGGQRRRVGGQEAGIACL